MDQEVDHPVKEMATMTRALFQDCLSSIPIGQGSDVGLPVKQSDRVPIPSLDVESQKQVGTLVHYQCRRANVLAHVRALEESKTNVFLGRHI